RAAHSLSRKPAPSGPLCLHHAGVRRPPACRPALSYRRARETLCLFAFRAGDGVSLHPSHPDHPRALRPPPPPCRAAYDLPSPAALVPPCQPAAPLPLRDGRVGRGGVGHSVHWFLFLAHR